MSNKNRLSRLLLPLTIVLAPFTSYLPEVAELNIVNWVLIISILSLIIDKYLDNKLYLSRIQLVGLILMSILVLLQSISILANSGNSLELVPYVIWLLFFTAICLYIDSNSDIVRLFQAGFCVGIILSIATISHILLFPNGLPFGDAYLGRRSVAGFTFPFQRSLGFEISYGTFGMYLMISVPYYIHKNIYNRSSFELLGILVIQIAVILSQSRSTWLATATALVVVFSVYVIEADKIRLRHFMPLSVLTLVAVGPIMVKKLISIRPGTFYARISQYTDGLSIAQSHPLLGVGLGNIERFREGPATIHNAFIRQAAQTGFLSSLIIICLWWITIAYLIKITISDNTSNSFGIGSLASIIAIFVELTFHPGFKKPPWIAIAIALSLSIVVTSQELYMFKNS